GLAALVALAQIRSLLRLLQRLAGEHAEGDRERPRVRAALHRQGAERARDLVGQHAVVVGAAAAQAAERDDAVDAALARDAGGERRQLEHACAAIHADALRLSLRERALRALEELLDDLRVPARGYHRESQPLRRQ